MKRAYTLLAFFGIVLIGLCAFSVSAAEKPDYPSYEDVISNVSHETSFVVADIQGFGVNSPADLMRPDNNNLAIIPYVAVLRRPEILNDPYLRRSQAWIRWNNINTLGKRSGVRHGNIQEHIGFKMLC